MVIGVGTDILNKNRIDNILVNECAGFISRIFTKAEQVQAASTSNPNHYYATRFAGKEAAFKTFSIPGNYIDLREIEILNNSIGIPYIKVTGKLKEIATSKGINDFKISLSYDGDYVVAFVVAIS